MNRRALITGVTGQDGSYLAEALLARGYDVHGAVRDLHAPGVRRLTAILRDSHHDVSRLHLHACDLTMQRSVEELCGAVRPDEIYNLAAQSHVGASFEAPLETLRANGVATLLLLEAIRGLAREGHTVRMFQAASSELFGAPACSPQTESTPFHPRSPYACSKAYAFHQVVNHREAYGLFCCNGILYNHESPRRPERYVTRKISLAAARIAAGLQQRIKLGNLDVGRDWGYAPEYMDAAWRMLQQDQPGDYVVATNEWHSLEQFLERAFQRVGLDWRSHLEQDPSLVRPAESARLRGDATRARRLLNWTPTVRFEQLVDLMVDADVALVQSQREPPSGSPG